MTQERKISTRSAFLEWLKIIGLLVVLVQLILGVRTCSDDSLPRTRRADCIDAQNHAVRFLVAHLDAAGIERVAGPVIRVRGPQGDCEDNAASYLMHGFVDVRDSSGVVRRQRCIVALHPADAANGWGEWVLDSVLLTDAGVRKESFPL